MENVNRRIEDLLAYGQKELYLSPEGKVYARNRLLELLQTEPTYEEYIDEKPNINDVLQELTDYAVENGIVDEEVADKFPDILMNYILPSQDDVMKTYSAIHFERGRRAAETYYWNIATKGKFVKKVKPGTFGWHVTSDNGDFGVMVLSETRPELEERFYPKCPYCLENIGFCGLPGEEVCYSKRVIPFEIGSEKWYFSYFQKQYFPNEFVVASEKHRPAGDGRSIAVMADIAEKVPSGFVMTDFEKQIHEHFCGGDRVPEIFKRPIKKVLFDGDYHVSIVDWCFSTLRIKCYLKKDFIRTVPRVIKFWRNFAEGNIVYPAVYCTEEGFFADLVCLQSGTPNMLFDKPDPMATFGIFIFQPELKGILLQLIDELGEKKVDFEKIHKSPELGKYLDWVVQIAAARGANLARDKATNSLCSIIGETCINATKSFSVSDEQLEMIYNETLKDFSVNQ